LTMKNQTPKDVFKTFFYALQTSDEGTVKNLLSEGAINLIENTSIVKNTSFDEALRFYLNFPFSVLLPSIGKERINKNMACLQVKNHITNEFEYFVFKRENNTWKLEVDCEVVAIETNLIERLIEYLQNVWSGFLEMVKTKS
jgi:hypothetical protein